MFNFLKKQKQPENLKEVISKLQDINIKLEKFEKELEGLKEKNKNTFQKMAILRFNPFNEMGGNQSFSLALLDENDNGIVITSLFTKEGNRIYGKPIKNGLSEYPLSEEEKKVIEKAKYKNGSKSNSKTAGSGNFGTYR